MEWLRRILGLPPKCNHEFTFHGWTYVECRKCKLVREDEKLNIKLYREHWEKILAGNPNFTKEDINSATMSRGRTTHLI